MGNFMIGKLLRWIGGRLDGYKTYAGGISAVVLGVLGLLGYMFPDQGLPEIDIELALGAISLGFMALGNGGKQEKTKDELQRILEELRARPLK